MRLPGLNEQPTQLIHGDWCTPNWLVDRTGTFTAVLDWQMARLGPPIVDLGQLLSGILMFSHLPFDRVAPKVTRAYRSIATLTSIYVGAGVLVQQLLVTARRKTFRDPSAMVGIGGLERQPARLRLALAFTLPPG